MARLRQDTLWGKEPVISEEDELNLVGRLIARKLPLKTLYRPFLDNYELELRNSLRFLLGLDDLDRQRILTRITASLESMAPKKRSKRDEPDNLFRERVFYFAIALSSFSVYIQGFVLDVSREDVGEQDFRIIDLARRIKLIVVENFARVQITKFIQDIYAIYQAYFSRHKVQFSSGSVRTMRGIIAALK